MFRAIVFLSLLVISMTYKITPIVEDGLPGFTNITTEPFLKIGEGYYYIETNLNKNWFEAYETCRLIGAELIAFETIEEWNLVNQYLQDKKINDVTYWTSGTDLGNTGKHVWFSNGLNITLDEIWYPGEPNNGGGVEHCDEMCYINYGFNDRVCSYNTRYICEAPQPKTAAFVVW
ncbi:C-type lectin 37Da-like [Drosophila tropicalis]|uniref:C-type lectin 37Da-like n=1 Tax=Drosophila tropicalis TaxID=46794 RepID=UPI0035AB6C10